MLESFCKIHKKSIICGPLTSYLIKHLYLKDQIVASCLIAHGYNKNPLSISSLVGIKDVLKK